MNSSKTGEDLSIMVNSDQRTLRIREINRRHEPSMQALSSLIAFLDKEN